MLLLTIKHQPNRMIIEDSQTKIKGCETNPLILLHITLLYFTVDCARCPLFFCSCRTFLFLMCILLLTSLPLQNLIVHCKM